jgi:hypothetical protein
MRKRKKGVDLSAFHGVDSNHLNCFEEIPEQGTLAHRFSCACKETPMRHFALVLIVLLTSAGMHFPQAGLVPAGTIYFNDSAADVMVLGNSAYYEIGLRKSNGAIAYIKDKSTGQNVTPGSRYECLWGTVFPKGTPDYVGGRICPTRPNIPATRACLPTMYRFHPPRDRSQSIA